MTIEEANYVLLSRFSKDLHSITNMLFLIYNVIIDKIIAFLQTKKNFPYHY